MRDAISPDWHPAWIAPADLQPITARLGALFHPVPVICRKQTCGKFGAGIDEGGGDIAAFGMAAGFVTRISG